MSTKNLDILKTLIQKVINDPSSVKEQLENASVEHLMETISIYQKELEYQNEELRRTQALLSQSERRYASLFYGAPFGKVLLNQDGVIQDLNDAFLQLIDKENAQVKHKPITNFIHQSAQDDFYLFWRAVDLDMKKDTFYSRLTNSQNQVVEVKIKIKHWEWSYANEAMYLFTFSDISELKQQQSEVQQQNFLLKQAQDIAKLGSFKLDLASKELVCSEMALQIFALPMNVAATYSTLLRYLTDEGQKAWQNAIERALEDKESFTFDTDINTYTSQKKRIRVMGKAVDIHQKTWIFSTIQDITHFSAMDTKMRIFEKAIQQSPVSMVITNEAGIIQYVNPKFTQVTGYTLEEAQGKNPRILKSGMLTPNDYVNLWQTISGGNTWRGTFLNIAKSGKEFWEKATISPIKNEQGDIVSYLGIKEDITEQRKSEHLLKESQRRYRVVAENTLNWEFWQAPDGSFIYHSPSCEKISGLKPEVFIQNPEAYFDLIHPEDLVDYREHHICRNNRKQEEVVEFRITTPQGEEKVIEHTCKPIFDEDGVYLGIRGTNVDVSERSFHTKRIEKQNQILKEIAWTQSHELRGPLSRALSLMPFLKERDFSIFDYPELVDAIQNTLNELDDLILKISEKTHLTKE